MRTYYLFERNERPNGGDLDERDIRLVLSDRLPRRASLVKLHETIEADCWLGAKKALGYELSFMQDLLLHRIRERAAK